MQWHLIFVFVTTTNKKYWKTILYTRSFFWPFSWHLLKTILLGRKLKRNQAGGWWTFFTAWMSFGLCSVTYQNNLGVNLTKCENIFLVSIQHKKLRGLIFLWSLWLEAKVFQIIVPYDDVKLFCIFYVLKVKTRV